MTPDNPTIPEPPKEIQLGLRDQIAELIKEPVPEEVTTKLRQYTEQAHSLDIYALLNKLINVDVLELTALQKHIRSLVEGSHLPESYLRFCADNPRLNKWATVFESSVDVTENPQSATEHWFADLFSSVNTQYELYEQAKTAHQQLSKEQADIVPQHEIFKIIATNLIKKYGIPENTLLEITAKLSGKVSFAKPLDIGFEKVGNGYKRTNSRGRHIRHASAIQYPTELYIDPANLGTDIAITEHELIHWLKTENYLQEDIYVPIASAQTTMAIHEAGESIVVEADTRTKGFKISQTTEQEIQKLVAEAQSPMEFYLKCQKLILPDLDISHIKDIKQLIGILKVKFDNHEEPDETYQMGTILGASLIVKGKGISTDYAQGFLAVLSRTLNLGQAEACGQLIGSEKYTTEQLMKKIEIPPLSQITDSTTYGEISDIVKNL